MVNITSLSEILHGSRSILGLDAYGVLYNNLGLFDTIPAVFDFCNQHQIPIYMMTNNATQSIPDISAKMRQFGCPIPDHQIISSGCGCYLIDHIKSILYQRSVFVYGYSSSRFYVEQAGGFIVESPADADVIVYAASQSVENHHMYKAVHDAIKLKPTMPLVCINPDHYVRNRNGFMRVMGHYTHQMMHQLQRDDCIWMGKPYSSFSDLVRAVLIRDGHDPSQLVFCDDNPLNVQQLTHDLNCRGVVITATGVADLYPMQLSSDLFQMPVCKVN